MIVKVLVTVEVKVAVGEMVEVAVKVAEGVKEAVQGTPPFIQTVLVVVGEATGVEELGAAGLLLPQATGKMARTGATKRNKKIKLK